MQSLDRPTFTNEARTEIYQYVERHGTAARHQTRSAVDVAASEFETELEWLLRKGYLEDDGGTLRLGLSAGAIEDHVGQSFSYTIRPAQQDDFEGLVETIRQATADDEYVVAESIVERLLYEDTVNRHNTVEARVFFVATREGDVIGWTHLDLPQVEKMQCAAQLTVGVRPDARGNGVGSQLMERALDWAAANSYRKVLNSVPTTNDKALAFLEKRGWHTEGIHRDHYEINGELVDEAVMVYTL